MLHLRTVDSPITPQLSSTAKAATETRHYCDMSGRITQYSENWGRHRQKRHSEDVNSDLIHDGLRAALGKFKPPARSKARDQLA